MLKLAVSNLFLAVLQIIAAVLHAAMFVGGMLFSLILTAASAAGVIIVVAVSCALGGGLIAILVYFVNAM